MKYLGPISDNKDLVTKEYVDKYFVEQTKTYTNVVMTANDDPNGWVYFAKFVPTSASTLAYVKYRVRAEAAGTTYSFNDSIVEYWTYSSNVRVYSAYNKIKHTDYRALYNHSLYRATDDGITSGYGHLLGIRFTSSWKPTTAANARTVTIDILETSNCTVTFFDSMVKYANAPGTGSTNYAGRSDYDGTTQGITITGDRNDVNYYNREYYSSRTTAAALYRYMLCLTKSDGTLLPVNSVNNSVATNKTMTTETFDPFGEIFYWGYTTTYSAGANVGDGYWYRQILFDLRYSFNCGGYDAAGTLTARSPLFLVATPQSDGTAKLYSSPLAQALPNSDDGLIYIYLGRVYPDTYPYRCVLSLNHPVYWYKNGAVREVSSDARTVQGHTVGIDVPSNAVFTDTNTTYALSGALSSHKFTSTLTAGGSGSGTTTSDFTLAAGTGISITDTADTRTMTIACTVTNTDENVKNTAVTAASTYYLTGSSSSSTATGGLNKHAAVAAYVTANSGTGGSARIDLGNTTATSSAGGKEGILRLYGTAATYYVEVKAGAPTANRTITFPNKTGTVALAEDIPEGAAASTTTPAMDGTANVGTETKFARGDHVHPTDTSRAASSHTHGNVQDGGALQTNDITIANGDKIVVTDASDSSKIARTSIAFDASTTTKCLTQKGTWETFGTSNLTIGTTASTAAAGNHDHDSKYISKTVADTKSAKLTISSGGLEVSGGGIDVTAGGIEVTSGGIEVSGGALKVTNGNIYTQETGYLVFGDSANALNAYISCYNNSTTNIHCLGFNAGSNSSEKDGYFAFWVNGTGILYMTKDKVYTVSGTELESKDKFTVTSGGAEITGGLTVKTSGLTVTSGGATITAGGLTVSGGHVRLANGNAIQSKNSGSAYISLLYMTSGNICRVGYGAYDNNYTTDLWGNVVYLYSKGNVEMTCKNTGSAGATNGKHTVVFETRSSDAYGCFRMARNDDCYLGNSSYRWRTLYSVNAVNTGSDRKMKDVTGSIDFAKELIMGLEPVDFMMKNGDHRRKRMGFIAQDAAALCKDIGENLSFV